MAGKDLEKPSPVVLFRDLREKARQLGLRDQDVSGLPALAEIQCGVKNYFLQAAKRSFKYLLFLACTLAIVWLLDWPVHNERIIRMWFHFRGLPSEDIELERCLLRTPDILSDALRPPLDCAFCRNVTSVHKVENISPEDFEERYAYSGQPVIVTDATRNWSALDAFSFEFFQQVYSQDSLELKNVENNCQFFPYKTTFRNLREVMQMEPRRARMEDSSEPWYIGWSNCDSSAGNVLRQHYQRPYFLPRVSESSKTDWIFMGSPGYGAHMHVSTHTRTHTHTHRAR
ncbi:hypothetical protein C0Q70_19002 [Pomacea canaliculata]|uniref:Cupin-like domain-containing protein n=1 Tax=Pomacea canaliculata TaxID=400727 RepID=A0A2T7NI42_POMCA|nr:hypothetical protein C0Q70_19002 [Pomacea canaliculata]